MTITVTAVTILQKYKLIHYLCKKHRFILCAGKILNL